METYDYIIIGGGIAGLYAYERVSKGKRVLLIEGSNKIGGRMGQDEFYGTLVSIGAGIGRKSKDSSLIKLLKKHEVKTVEFPVVKRWTTLMQENESRMIIERLKREYNPVNNKGMRFKEYAVGVLGAELYKQFIKHYEYTDIENGDVYETLFYYGLEDNNNGWTGLSIPWNELLSKMKPGNIVYNHRVKKIRRLENSEELVIDNKYVCKKVIIACTISGVRKLLPMHSLVYRQIESQPFMRIYGKFSKENAEKLHNRIGDSSIIVNNQIKRIIPINVERGIYMIVYSDNSNANYVERHVTGNNVESREWLCRKLEEALDLPLETLKLTGIKKYYWKEGTHYYMPFTGNNSYEKWITHAQHPEKGIYVVGEMISRDQGWVEGALRSVDAILPYL